MTLTHLDDSIDLDHVADGILEHDDVHGDVGLVELDQFFVDDILELGSICDLLVDWSHSGANKISVDSGNENFLLDLILAFVEALAKVVA